MAGELRIRIATLGDAQAIARVHVASWQSSYRGIVPQAFLDALDVDARAARWRAILAEPGRAAFDLVAERGERVVGFASAGPAREEGPWASELYAIYLLEEEQGRGTGRALLRAVAQRLVGGGARGMYLWVLAENARARGFYERAGGRLAGERRDEIGGVAVQEVRYVWGELRASPLGDARA